jgi:RimJ/RimL family protein N-acetyltransferase
MRSVNLFPFIKGVRSNYRLEELKTYLGEINSSLTTLQLSIFTKSRMSHIGNIKFHDINLEFRTCFVGFLIGHQEWQNKGVAKEVFDLSSATLFRLFNVSQFKLGVDLSHAQAIRSYRKIGFVHCMPYQTTWDFNNTILMAKTISLCIPDSK